MDKYQTTQTAVSGQKLNPNRGVYICHSGVCSNNAPVDIITFDQSGKTYSTRISLSGATSLLVPIRMWGVSFGSPWTTNAFGIS